MPDDSQNWPVTSLAVRVMLETLWPSVLFVDGVNGSDAAPARQGYATITAALGDATSGQMVFVLPTTVYTEQFTIGAGVFLNANAATITTSASPGITMMAGSRLDVSILNVGDAHIGVLQATALARSIVNFGTTTVGAAGFGFINTAADAILAVNGTTINLAAAAFAFGDVTTSDGHIDVDVNNIYAEGAAAFGLATFGAGSIEARVGHFRERGGTMTAITAQGTDEIHCITTEIETATGILCNATSEVWVTAPRIECTAAYNVTAGGLLCLSVADLVGTRTGIARLSVAGEMHNSITEIDDTDSPYAILDADSSIYADATAGDVIANLPTAVNRRGKRYEHLAVDVTNTSTLVPQAGEEIRQAGGVVHTNALPYTAAAQYDTLTVESDGTNWYLK